MARLARSAAVAITLDPEDEERARVQAERRDLEYQDYVKMVVDRALLVEDKDA